MITYYMPLGYSHTLLQKSSSSDDVAISLLLIFWLYHYSDNRVSKWEVNMGGDIDAKELSKLYRLFESDYYGRVLDAWFTALQKADGNPDRIIKKYIIEDGGIVNHQRFNHYFRTLDTLYDKMRLRFCLRVKQVAHSFEHQYITAQRLWEQYFDAVLDCRKECKAALVRKDMRFFEASLAELHLYFEKVVCETEENHRVYQYCIAASLGIVIKAVDEWDKHQYQQEWKLRLSQEVAALAFSLDHMSATFSRIIGAR